MAEARTCPKCTGPLDRLDLHCPFCGAVFSRLKDADSSRTAPTVAASPMTSPSTSYPASAFVAAANSALPAGPPASLEPAASPAAFPSAPSAAVPFETAPSSPSPSTPVYKSAVAAAAPAPLAFGPPQVESFRAAQAVPPPVPAPAAPMPEPPPAFQTSPPAFRPAPERPAFGAPGPAAPAPGYAPRLDGDNPYRAPRTSVDPGVFVRESTEASLTPARRFRRLAAHFLDYMIIIMPPVILVGIFGNLDPEEFTSEDWLFSDAMGLIFLAMIPLLVVNFYLLSKYGQTMGKRALGIKIVRTDGTQPSLARIIFLRAFAIQALGSIPFIGSFIGLLDALFIFGEERRCIHDHFADTMVVVA